MDKDATVLPVDYAAAADLYPRATTSSRSRPVGYRRFDTTAEALRYAIEEMPAAHLSGALLEVDEERYDGAAMRSLYDAGAYPLPRSKPRV